MKQNPFIIEEQMVDGCKRIIRYRLIHPGDIKFTKKFHDTPPPITIESIENMTNKNSLKELEIKYDDFLEKNQQLLLLYDVIEEYLEIRDAITIRVSRLERMERMNNYMEYYKKLQKHEYINEESSDTEEENIVCEYSHNCQSLLPNDLRLTSKQIDQGYVPYPNEPKEFKCGCLTIKYYSQCCCKRVSTICKNPKCNEKNLPIIKLNTYCIPHGQLKKKEEDLEAELKKIKKELSAITRQSNSLDFENYKNSIKKTQKRRSRFPWKTI
jgi:hypothetical protein